MPNSDEGTPVAVDNDDEEFGSSLAKRLRLAIGDRNQSDVAQSGGVDRKTLGRYLRGEVPKLRALIGIAQLCGVSFEWLATGKIEPINGAVQLEVAPPEATSQFLSDTGKSRYVAIPRLNIAASAGHGALAEHEQIVEYFAFDLDFVRNHLRRDPKNLVLIEARGDSMDPNIRDGDILAVDLTPGQPLHNAQLYVIRVGENLMVKRLELRLDGGVIVHSDNPRYAPETVSRSDLNTLNILGQVILVSAPPR